MAPARAYAEDGLALFRSLNDDRWTASALHDLGLVLAKQGDHDQAVALLEEARETWRAIGNRWGIGCCSPTHLARIARARGENRRAVTMYQESLILSYEEEDRWQIALNLLGLAALSAARGPAEQAARLLGAATVLRETIDAPPTPNEQADQRAAMAARVRLGEQAFMAAYAAGRALTLEEAVAEATALTLDAANTGVPATRPQPSNHEGLTRRELDVLRLLIAGETDRQIANTLFISRRTANAHVSHIYAKLGVNSRAEAAAKAVRLGLVPGEPS